MRGVNTLIRWALGTRLIDAKRDRVVPGGVIRVDYLRLHDVSITDAGIYNGNLSVADSVAPKVSPYFFPPGRGNKEVESRLRKQKAANTG